MAFWKAAGPYSEGVSHRFTDSPEFDVESFRMVYLASKGRLGKVICEKHTFLNSRLSPTVRVSHTTLTSTPRAR